MKAQVYIVFEQAIDPELILKDKEVIWKDSGLPGGVLVNCETDDALLRTLKFTAGSKHHVDVKMLTDDEPFPTRDERIKDVLATDV